MSNRPVELDASIDDQPEHGDHPDEVTPAEAVAGHRVYLAVDDLDDDSNGQDAL